jgi:hypothetical protein
MFKLRATYDGLGRIIAAMPTTLRRTAEITVELPRDQAMMLFTPEGERRWADGWNPDYPQPDRREGPGAVFTTAHGEHQTTWIMVDHAPDRIRYARVAHGTSAGTVTVEVVSSREHDTKLRVTYDLTALSAAGETWLQEFGAAYHAELAGWATEIAASLQRPGQPFHAGAS